MATYARQFVSASNQYLHFASAIVAPGSPSTLACWVYLDSSAFMGAISVTRSAATYPRAYLGASSARKCSAIHSNAVGTNYSADSLAAASLSTWAHFACVMRADGYVESYLNGTASVSATPYSDAGGDPADLTLIGAGWNAGAVYLPLNGRLFWPAIWNKALSVAQIASLVAHTIPSRIEQASLKSFPNLETLADDYAGGSWTNHGSTTVAAPDWSTEWTPSGGQASPPPWIARRPMRR